MRKQLYRVAALFMTVMILLSALPVSALAANSGIDTSGVKVTDSGNYGSGYGPELTVDGNLDNRWAGKRPNADYVGGYWLAYEFPAAITVEQIKVWEISNGDGNRITDITVKTSENGSEWTEVQKFSGLKDNGLSEEALTLKTPLETRYLQLYIDTALREESGVMRQGEPNVCEVAFYEKAEPVANGDLLLKYYDITKDSVRLYWPELDGAESYDIYQADAALGLTLDDMTKINTQPVTELEYQVTGLAAGSEYRFMVVAHMADGQVYYSNQANVPTAKQLSGTGLESGENTDLKMPYSSLALNMEYKGPTISDAGWFNWCVSPIEVDGKYHLFTSRWPDNMNNWMVKGQIIHSVADSPEGPYELQEVILCDPELLDTVDESQRDTVITDLPGHAPHNCRIKKVGDQYALTFIMQTDGLSGVRGQKIALLVSDSINGPWKWAGGEKGFVVEPSTDPNHWTYNSVVGTDNHDIIYVDGEYRIYFKAGPGQNATMHYGYAYSDTLEGPYTLCDEPALSENKNYIEDATVFEWNDTIYLLSTDNYGTNTGVLGYGILWKSNDRGKTFRYADAKIGYGLMKDYIKWPVTGAVDVYNGQTAKFERPAILMGEDGNPEYFFGTLGMNLDGNATAQSFMLKINWQPSSVKTLVSVGGETLNGLTGTGTAEAPETAALTLAMDAVTLNDIVSGGDRVELYQDSGFTQAANTVTLAVGKATHLYIKVIAEDDTAAYYDIAVTSAPTALPWGEVTVTDSGHYGSEFGDFDPANTIDGNLNTRWAARRPSEDYKGDFYLSYEFAESKRFDEIKVYEIDSANDGNRIKRIQVQTSEDGTQWNTIQSFEGLKDNGQNTETLHLNQAVETRYLRLVLSTDLRPEEQNKQAEPNVLEVELYYTGSHTHVLEKTDAKDATCTEDGNIAYWYCGDCRKYFKDETAVEEITKEQTVIKALGHSFTEWGHDDAQHWKVCTRCKAVDESTRADHQWIKDSENSTSTSIHYTCECGAEKTEQVSGGGSTTTRYTITVTQTSGGKISPSTASVTRGGSKTFTITADEGYRISDVLVDGKSVGTVSTYTFENVKARHTITAKFEKIEEITNVGGFLDVQSNDWFAEAVQYVVDEGLMNGTSSDKFTPGGATTRGMIVTILYRQAGSPEVESDGATWWSDARAWAMANGISDGTNMDKEITREQLATMLYRYAELTGEDVSKTTSLDSFKDGDKVSDYAVDALKWAVAEGIVTGKTDGVIDPQAGATRAETATMLMRFCERI